MAAIDKLRQRTLLPQYAGRAVNKIFDVPPNTTATAAEDNPFEKAVEALINYITPQKNESLRFMYSYKQSKNPKRITAFHTKLRQLARVHGLCDINREIKTPIGLSSSSQKLQMKSTASSPTVFRRWKGHGTLRTPAATIEYKMSWL